MDWVETMLKKLVNELDKCIEVYIRMIEGKGKLDSNKDVQFCICMNESIDAKLIS
jgi:hypothetical protein